MLNQTNIRGTTNTNFAERNISIGPYQAAHNGQLVQTVQANFHSPVRTAGSFFGSVARLVSDEVQLEFN